jgi:hypothetical protein
MGKLVSCCWRVSSFHLLTDHTQVNETRKAWCIRPNNSDKIMLNRFRCSHFPSYLLSTCFYVMQSQKRKHQETLKKEEEERKIKRQKQLAVVPYSPYGSLFLCSCSSSQSPLQYLFRDTTILLCGDFQTLNFAHALCQLWFASFPHLRFCFSFFWIAGLQGTRTRNLPIRCLLIIRGWSKSHSCTIFLVFISLAFRSQFGVSEL